MKCMLDFFRNGGQRSDILKRMKENNRLAQARIDAENCLFVQREIAIARRYKIESSLGLEKRVNSGLDSFLNKALDKK